MTQVQIEKRVAYLLIDGESTANKEVYNSLQRLQNLMWLDSNSVNKAEEFRASKRKSLPIYSD